MGRDSARRLGYRLTTSRVDRPDGKGPDHLHRGGLWVVRPADERRPHAMLWFPDRPYRLAYWQERGIWHVQVEDDLRWAAVARVLVVPSPLEYVDVAATPDGTPMLCRHDTYLVRHENVGDTCEMTLTTASAH